MYNFCVINFKLHFPGGINLKIFENLNDVFILVTNKTLEATIDKNLSLTCKAFDSVGNDVNDDYIIWGKRGKGLK